MQWEMVGPLPQNVLIYNFPFEGSHDAVRLAFSFFGEIEYVSYRHWTHMMDLCDGVKVVRMTRSRADPWEWLSDRLIQGDRLIDPKTGCKKYSSKN